MSRWDNAGYKSYEEWIFNEWLVELGIRAEYQPEPFTLTEPVKIPRQMPRSIKEAHLLNGHSYQADFSFAFDEIEQISTYLFSVDISQLPIQERLKKALFLHSNGLIIIDTKGSNHMSSKRNSDITFPLNQKWVYKEHGMYVNSVVPTKLFDKTFYPEQHFYSESGQDRWKKTNGGKVYLKDMLKKKKDCEVIYADR